MRAASLAYRRWRGRPSRFLLFTRVGRGVYRLATDDDLFLDINDVSNGWFVGDGDIWGGSRTDKTQFRMQIDAVTGMYRNGFGRRWADGM